MVGSMLNIRSIDQQANLMNADAGVHGQLRGPDRVLVREGRRQQARRRQVVDADGEGTVGGAVGRDPQVAAVPEGVREPGAQGGHGHQRAGARGDGDPGGLHRVAPEGMLIVIPIHWFLDHR